MNVAQSDFTSPFPRAQRKAVLGNSTVLEALLMEAGADISAHRQAHRIRSSIASLYQSAHLAAYVACHRSLCTERPIAGILIAFASPKPRALATSPFCLPCWREPIEERSRHSERALGRIIVGGKWLDPIPDTS